jgi:hypothetical protein
VLGREATAAEVAKVEKYLATKWGISGVHVPATATSDPVGAWLDKSGNARHATQSTSGYRGVVGTQGTRRAITLDGTDDHLLLGNLSAAFPAAGEVVVAYALNALDSAYTVYQTSDNANSDVFGSITFAGAFRNTRLQGLTFTGPSSAGTHLWGTSSQSSGYRLWVEGCNALSTTADHTGGTSHAIGMRSATPGANQALNGKLLEVCAFNRVLSTAERGRLNRYLAAKWGITLAPQVSNADAQDWINRVYSNGGTVSASTAAAVDAFCNAIDAAGIRSRFYRLNLFTGNSDSSLNAVRTPLYRGPSRTGTQYGGTTDTSVNFAPTDYSLTTGLTGNSTTGKYLNTGFPANTLVSNDIHLAAGVLTSSPASSGSYLLGTVIQSGGDATALADRTFSGGPARFGKTASTWAGSSGAIAAGAWVMSYPNVFFNGSAQSPAATAFDTPASTSPHFVFGANLTGTAGGSATGSRLGWYSIGTAFGNYAQGGSVVSSADEVAFRNAITAFQAAIGRA